MTEQEWHPVNALESTCSGYDIQQLGEGNERRLVDPKTGCVVYEYLLKKRSVEHEATDIKAN